MGRKSSRFRKRGSNNSNNNSNTNKSYETAQTNRYNYSANRQANFHPYQTQNANNYANNPDYGIAPNLNSHNSYNRSEQHNNYNDQFCNSNNNYKSNNYNSNNVIVNYPSNIWETTTYNTSFTNYNYNQPQQINLPNISNGNEITQVRQLLTTPNAFNAPSSIATETNKQNPKNPFLQNPNNFSKSSTLKQSSLNDQKYRRKPRNIKHNRSKNQKDQYKFKSDRRRNKTQQNYRSKGKRKTNSTENLSRAAHIKKETEHKEEREEDNYYKEENEVKPKVQEIEVDSSDVIDTSDIIKTEETLPKNDSNKDSSDLNEQAYSSNEYQSAVESEKNLEKVKKKRQLRKDPSNTSNENIEEIVEEVVTKKVKKDKKDKQTKEKKHKKQKEYENELELNADNTAIEQIIASNPKTNSNKIDNANPKISLIPLTRLLANDFVELIDPEGNTNTNKDTLNLNISDTSSNKEEEPLCKLEQLDQLDEHKRNPLPYTKSLTTSNAFHTILTKLTSMDKSSIKNIINTSDTMYDNALTALARKRLREELRRQLKAINFDNSEQILNKDIVPDEIVDSIHIPDRVLDEIRKALGMTMLDDITSNHMELSLNVLKKEEDNCDDIKKEVQDSEHFSLMPTEFASTLPEPVAESASLNYNNPIGDGNNLPTSTTQNNFDDRVKQDSNRNPNNVTKSLELCLKVSPKSRSSSSSSTQRSIEKGVDTVHFDRTEQDVKIKKDRNIEKHHLKKKAKKTRERKKSFRKQGKKNLQEVIVIESSTSSSSSSSSSTSSSNSSSSSSSTSSSSSDTDSDNTSSSFKSSASLKKKRLKLKLDAQNVINNFDKLIVPHLSETLAGRYRTKYATSINTKLYFILCICTSDYNSERFTKSEISTVQKNLKSSDYSMTLDFLMKQIINVFNKQKRASKAAEIKKSDNEQQSPLEKKSSLKKNNKIKEQSPELNNQISSTIETTTAMAEGDVTTDKENIYDDDVRLCVTKMLSMYKEEMKVALKSVKEQAIKPTIEAVPCISTGKHNLKEEILPTTKDVSATDMIKISKMQKDSKCNRIPNAVIDLQDKTNKENVTTQITVSNQENEFVEISGTPIQQQHYNCQPQQQHQQTQFEEKMMNDGTQNDNILNLSNMDSSSSSYNEINASTFALVQHSALSAIDLNAFKVKNPHGEAVVKKLHEIDLKLLELHERKMSIEKKILDLQKDKMEADLLTRKLQDEKFILLNTAITANAINTEFKSSAKSQSLHMEDITKDIKKEKYDSEYNHNQVSEVNTTTDSSNTNTNINLNSCLGREQRDSEASRKKAKFLMPSTSPTSTTAMMSPTTKRKNNDPISAELKKKRSNSHKDKITKNKDDLNKGIQISVKSAITQIKVFDKNIVAATENGTLCLFDMKTLKLIGQFSKHTEAITKMYLCMEKKVIYTISLDGYLKKTSLENFEIDIISINLQEPLQSLDIRWGVAYLGSRWGNVYTYNISENHVSEKLLCKSTSPIIEIKATENGTQKMLIISSKGNLVQLRDAITGLLLRTLDIPDKFKVYCILLDDNIIYCGTQRKDIHKFDLMSGLYLGALTCGNGAVTMQSYNDRYIFVGCYDGYIYVMHKVTGIQSSRIMGSGKVVLTIEINNNKIITTAKDHTMKIVNIPSYVTK